MRTNADRARRGRQAFNAMRHDDNDTITNVYDLICDIAHFADTIDGREYGFDVRGDDTAGHYVLSMAQMHYSAERKEEEDERRCREQPA